MKLQQLVLENFRPYEGRQVLSFASSPERNVTIVYGANGGGKTTLLNAFLWALYGEFTTDLENKEAVINNQVWSDTNAGEYAEASVTLQFEHEGNQYVITRTAKATKDSDISPQTSFQSRLAFRFTDSTGRSYDKANGDEAIDQIIPKRLKDFFFFNGERIENLVKPAAYDEIESAIKTLLGLELIERAYHKHLPEAKKRLQADLGKLGDDSTKSLIFEQERLQDARTESERDLQQTIRNLNALAENIEAIDQQLRSLESTRQLQQRRDVLQAEYEKSRSRELHARAQIAKVLNDQGFLAFMPDLLDSVAEASAQLRSRGELPTPMKRQFVEDLLDEGTCICGTSLVPGESPHDHVSEWKFKAGIQEVEESWLRLSSEVEHCRDDRKSLAGALDELEGRIATELTGRLDIEEQLSQVTTELKGSDQQDVQALEARRTGLMQDQRRLDQDLGILKHKIASSQQEEQRIEGELRKAAAHGEKALLAKRRVDAVSDVRALLGEILELRTQNVRRELDERIRETYRSISFKPYTPELNEGFALELWQEIDGQRLPVPKSTGENQILSLSFVGALAALARDRDSGGARTGGILDTLGGIFPIVMDAPFGSLDENYRRDVARVLPRLAPQIVLLASKSQGQGPVQEELAEHIGAAYVMTFHSTKEGASTETIDVAGKAVPYVIPGAQSDRAELVEVQGVGS